MIACGYVNANGTTSVTLFTSGVNSTPFYSGLAGQTISINNVNYTISTVNSSTSITTGTTVPTAGGTGYAVGTPTDNGNVFICGTYVLATCQTEPPGNTNPPYGVQYQTVLVTAVSGSAGNYTLTVSPSLYMPNWAGTTTQGAVASWFTPTVGEALEDMSVMNLASSQYLNSSGSNVQVSDSYAPWVKGVRFVGSGSGQATSWTQDKSGLLFNNYLACDVSFIANNSYSGFHKCILLQVGSDSLFLNNIGAIGIPQTWEGGDSGIVTAYNYGRDAFTGYAFNLWNYDHASHGSFDLFEGNESGTMHEDGTWGTHNFNTYNRNMVFCHDYPYVGGGGSPYGQNSHGIYIDVGQRFSQLIGNVIGSSYSQCPTAFGTGYGSAIQYDSTDALNIPLLMRWGNVTTQQQSTDTPSNSGIRFVSSEVPATITPNNYCTASATPYSCCTGSGTGSCSASTWQNSVPANNNLPCSFYFSVGTSPCTPLTSGGTGLSFWKVCKSWTTFPTSCATTQLQPFPPAGPEDTSGPYVNGHGYDNPAGTAWYNLPIDTTLQNTYAISSSAWSSTCSSGNGGTYNCETLTFSGGVLPNTEHLQGAFQLPTANAACLTGATINAASELLMTNSSSTTISYALTSNPGVSCTGNMAFPDVRQFDERVYQADSSSTPTLSAPAASFFTQNRLPRPLWQAHLW